MINKDSIVTAYDEHLTLVEWLQKVEKALDGASAVSFNVNKRGNATLTFSVVFEDGSEIESNPIVLEQGESVNDATIRNGHLILTLTNGDELDAGNLGGVSGFSIDASQHLIVTYQNGTTQDLGAIFNGNVVINGSVSTPILTSANDHIEAQKPVIETMAGYSFAVSADLPTLTLTYVGAVKNGNKLTIALFGSFTKTAEVEGTEILGNLTIPSSVGAKLYPFSISGLNNVLEVKNIALIYAINSTSTCIGTILKYNNSTLTFNLRGLDALPEGNTYLFRFEATFLLSDNLAE